MRHAKLKSKLFPYTTLFRSMCPQLQESTPCAIGALAAPDGTSAKLVTACGAWAAGPVPRSEEHTSELQSLTKLVCRLLLEKKKQNETQKEIAGIQSAT